MTDPLASITGIPASEPVDLAAIAAEVNEPEPEAAPAPVAAPVVAPAPAAAPTPQPTKRSRRAAGTPTPDTNVAGLGCTPEQLRALNVETPDDEISHRPADFRDPSGKQLAYVDARYVMDVLDETVGAWNWASSFESLPDGAVRCTITVFVNNGTPIPFAVSKTDVGKASNIEPEKGAHSDAFKRAAVHFGIARDLYDERISEGVAAAVAAALPMTPTAMVPPTYAATAAAGMAAPTLAAQTAPVNTAAPQPMFDPMTGQPLAAAPVAAAPGGVWVCPIHGTSRIQPAGISKKGVPYAAFWTCTERGCNQTGGNA